MQHRSRIVAEGGAQALWRYTGFSTQQSITIAPPAFEIDGKKASVILSSIEQKGKAVCLHNGVIETIYHGQLREEPSITLELIVREHAENPVVRFKYRLKSTKQHLLTKVNGADALTYCSWSLADFPDCKEVRFSEFDESIHSYRLVENKVPEHMFDNACRLMGPMLVAANDKVSLLCAYEHGSQAPDAFIEFHCNADRTIAVQAYKGNYYNNQILGPDNPYETIWFEFAAVLGSEDLLASFYRTFVLKYMSPNSESRKPHIFYNTWCFQERNKWYNKKTFLASMNQERILDEIETAHKMGVDVFVIDTGWYEKTGDWRVDRNRFDEDLQTVRKKLDGYGMKLGLWFSPTQAAVSSKMRNDHKDCIMSWQGKESPAHMVWETEASQNMCLVSRYWEAFADELVRLVKEVGVTYFKWDAIGQYGCDGPNHWHGTAANSSQERADAYAFQLGTFMCKVIDKLCVACPQAIVDFDVTEGGRFVGLGFLSAGKYFLINNGPYYHNFEIPFDSSAGWCNIFVFPGHARPRVCRAPLSFDKWVPSILFLTHYLPDDPQDSQLVNIASLILGQNGFWGDLPGISKEGVDYIGKYIALYKQVRNDITESAPVCTGIVGASPEIYEKISSNKKGVVVLFSSVAGKFSYVTQNPADTLYVATQDVGIKFDTKGRACIDVVMEKPGAVIVFFGAK